jgi:hypothetical protein
MLEYFQKRHEELRQEQALLGHMRRSVVIVHGLTVVLLFLAILACSH